MDKRVAILQSNYIPWKGYFDIIGMVDEFILFDEMQYTRRDWRNRNQIKTNNGLLWITIPVSVKGKYHQKIIETTISDKSWANKHWRAIEGAYAKAPHFKELKEFIQGLYQKAAEIDCLSQVNYLFLTGICDLLGIKTKISWDHDYEVPEGKSERLLQLTLQAGGTTYLSGPAAKDYLDESVFDNAGVKVEWMEYSGYPEYSQLHGEFVHGVSVLDLLFNCGNSASDYIKSSCSNIME